MTDQSEINRLYDLLRLRIDTLKVRYNGRLPTALDLQANAGGTFTRGVYFFFEPGEMRAETKEPRVVRIGTNTGEKSSIESRIVGEHLKQWGRSVFRRHLGTALIRRGFPPGASAEEREEFAEMWYDMKNGWPVQSMPEVLDPVLHPLQPVVTKAIAEMPVAWVEVPSTEEATYLEKQCISLLSNYLRRDSPIDPPSESWLGLHAWKPVIRQAGLWNIKHAISAHTPGFLEEFAARFEGCD